MRSVVILALACSLSAAPVYAQAPAPPPAQAAQAPQPPAVFPEGAKVAFVNLQAIAQVSADGKASTARVQALIAKKEAEAAAKAKQLQDNQTKLQQGGALLNDTARTQLERDVEKAQVDAQRFQQDAEAEITQLQTELQADFQRKLFPVLYQMSQEKGLHVLFSAADAGVIWADPGVDLTLEAIKRFDAASATPPAAAPPAPAAKP